MKFRVLSNYRPGALVDHLKSRPIYVVMFFFLWPFLGVAQDRKLDSLLTCFANDKDQLTAFEQYEPCMNVVRTYFYEQMSEESLSWVDSAFTIKGLDSAKIVRLMAVKGRLLSDFNHKDSAVAVLTRGESIALRNSYKDEYARILSSLGCVFLELGDYESAIEKLYKALHERRMIGGENAFVPYTNLGVLHYKLKDYKTAFRYFSIADSLSGSSSPDTRVNKAICLVELGDLRSARDILAEELKDQLPFRERAFQMIRVFFSLGYADLKDVKLVEAKKNLKLALRYAGQCKDFKFMSDSYIYLAKCHLYNDPDSALLSLSAAETVAKSNGLRFELLVAYDVLADVYYSLNNTHMRVLYQQMLLEQKRKVHPIRLSNLLSLKKAEEAERTLNASIEAQERIIEKRERTVSFQEDIVSLNWIFAFSLMVLISVLIFHRLQNRRNALVLEAILKNRYSLLDSVNSRMMMTIDNGNSRLAEIEARVKQLSRLGTLS